MIKRTFYKSKYFIKNLGQDYPKSPEVDKSYDISPQGIDKLLDKHLKKVSTFPSDAEVLLITNVLELMVEIYRFGWSDALRAGIPKDEVESRFRCNNRVFVIFKKSSFYEKQRKDENKKNDKQQVGRGKER